MSTVLNKNRLIYKDRFSYFYSSVKFDIIDTETGDPILTCNEPKVSFFSRLIRSSKLRNSTAYYYKINNTDGSLLFSIKKKSSFFSKSIAEVFDHNNQMIGTFTKGTKSTNIVIPICNPKGEQISELKSNAFGRKFEFKHNDHVFANISKKWDGFIKEIISKFLSNSDSYKLEISESIPDNKNGRLLMIASVICIDIFFY